MPMGTALSRWVWRAHRPAELHNAHFPAYALWASFFFLGLLRWWFRWECGLYEIVDEALAPPAFWVVIMFQCYLKAHFSETRASVRAFAPSRLVVLLVWASPPERAFTSTRLSFDILCSQLLEQGERR